MKKTRQSAPNESIFRDREKEAKFWEENFDDAWEAGKPRKAKFAKNLSETINIRLDSKTLNIVRDEAKNKGLGPTQLIRMWILEKIGKKVNPAGV
ncbi:BrnA antitoxin family protein [Patescibacteria group bacterium]|nr:BrnA antitoxin family protein [Patescibacteria group bacterium]MBU4016774.1 BrnA antitoxin family protein [Patescibacteria group bacterium]MBU4098702.1 BrnA antitoxin family protein [Patescibacteria group bacterium]